ncbi:MAG TPA: TetR/AcrR family transcriptional regulator [Roseiflexaceae bacterium]|jgi:AcrR family transcriptional regulator
MKNGRTTTRIERVRTASRQRREQEKRELHAAILQAAGRLFTEQGYERFSLRQVAEMIGYSATTIYLYFKDKDDLLFAVVDEGFDRFGQQLAAAAASTDDPIARLQAIGRAYIDFGLQNPVHYQLMFMQRADFLIGHRPGEQQPRIDAFRVLQGTVLYGIDLGALRPGDVESYSDALWALVHGVVALGISMPFISAERIQRTADTALAMSLEGLRRT